jgi:hypothetical protein
LPEGWIPPQSDDSDDDDEAAYQRARRASEVGPRMTTMTIGSSAANGGQRKEAVIVWDWDDTLIPTTWLNELVMPKQDDAKFKDQLTKQTQLIRDAILASHACARVVIVTLANQRWVQCTLDRFFVGIQGLIERLGINIVYAAPDRATYGDIAFAAKKDAMQYCLKGMYPDANKRKNVLSIGDMDAEHNALKHVLSDGVKGSLCKTIKLREKPSITEIQIELTLITPLLGKLMTEESSFDKTTEGMMFKAFPKLTNR